MKVYVFERFGRTKEAAVSGLRSEYEIVKVQELKPGTISGNVHKGINEYRVTVRKLPIGVGKGKRFPGPGEDWR